MESFRGGMLFPTTLSSFNTKVYCQLLSFGEKVLIFKCWKVLCLVLGLIGREQLEVRERERGRQPHGSWIHERC